MASQIVLRFVLATKDSFMQGIKSENPDEFLMGYRESVRAAFTLSRNVFTMLLTGSDNYDKGISTDFLYQMIKDLNSYEAKFLDMSIENLNTFFSLATLNSAITFGDLVNQSMKV